MFVIYVREKYLIIMKCRASYVIRVTIICAIKQKQVENMDYATIVIMTIAK